MQPEISHRCPACGVAVRGTSLFCPQCGRPLKKGAPSVASQKAEATEAPARTKSDSGLNTSVLAPPASNMAETSPDKETVKSDAPAVDKRTAVGATTPLAREVEESAARRMTTSTRDGSEGKRVAPRVEKLRSASSAVLEEASSDPSLRFVLVAIVIILLTLLLLLLNHLLG